MSIVKAKRSMLQAEKVKQLFLELCSEGDGAEVALEMAVVMAIIALKYLHAPKKELKNMIAKCWDRVSIDNGIINIKTTRSIH